MGRFGVRVGPELIKLGRFSPWFDGFEFLTYLICGLGLILVFSPPSNLLVEWREVRKKLPPVRRVANEGLPMERVQQAESSHP